jgi:hypothetical protein
LRSMY